MKKKDAKAAAVLKKGSVKTAKRPPESSRAVKQSRPAPKRTKTPQYHQNIIDCSPEIIIAVDTDRKIMEFNAAAEKAFGYRAKDVVGKHADILYENAGEGLRVQDEIRATGEFMGEITNRRKDGSIFKTFLSASLLHDRQGRRLGVIGLSRDITDRKLMEEALERSERFLNTIFESINDPFSIIDRNFRIVRVNNAYAAMRHKETQDLVGKQCYVALQNRAAVCSDCVVKKTFDSGHPCAKEKHLTFPDGTEVWVEIYTYPILDERGAVSHVIEYTRDITGRKKADEDRRRFIEKLEYISNTDELTGLLNRRALIDKLNYEVARSARYKSALAVILCDIDSFKDINDAYGHMVGDRALKIVGEVLRGALRKTDMVGRYGGDEFMLILPETTLQGAEEFAERIRAYVENTWIQVTEEKAVKMTMSLGVTSSELIRGDIQISALIKNADSGLYTAKRTGRNRVCVVSA